MANEWQSIETCPQDLNPVLLWWPFQRQFPLIGARNYRVADDGDTFVFEDSWWVEWDRFRDDGADPGPTHWMPLPDPPTKAERTQP